MVRSGFLVLFILVFAVLFLGSCESSDKDPSVSHPISPDLQELLDWQNEALAGQAPQGLAGPAFEDYLNLKMQINNPQDYPDAAQTFFDRWENDPSNVFWLVFAHTQGHLLNQKTRQNELFQSAAGPDSTSQVGELIFGIRYLRSKESEATSALARCGSQSDDPNNLYSLWAAVTLARHVAAQDTLPPSVLVMKTLIPRAWEAGGPLLASEFWIQLASILKGSDLPNESLQAAIMAKQCAERGGNDYQVLLAENDVGLGQRSMKQPDKSLATFSSIGDKAMARGFLDLAWYSAYQGGIDARTLGDTEEELRQHHRAVWATGARADTLLHYRFTAILANDHRRAGNLDSAFYWIEEAKVRRELFPGPDHGEYVITTEARILNQLGRYAEAESLRASLNLDLTDPVNRRGEVSVMISLVRMGLETGNPALCFRSLDRAWSLEPETLEPTPNYDPYLQLSMVSAEFYAKQGELHLAHEHLVQADTRLEDITQESLWYLTRIQGVVAAAGGDEVVVLESYEKCLQIATVLKDPDLINRSRVQLGAELLDRGRSEEAEKLFSESQKAPEYWTRLTSRLWTGLARSRGGNHRGALKAFEEVEELLEPDAPVDIMQRLYLEMGRSQVVVGNKQKAREAFEWARNLARKQVKDSEVLGRLNDEIQREIAEAHLGLIFDNPKIFSGVERVQKGRDLAAWGRTGGLVEKAAIRAGPSPRLEFFLGPERGFAWVCGASSGPVQWLEIPATETLSRWVRAAHTDLSYPDRDVDQALLARISAALLLPLGKAWQPEEVLEILPDGVLGQLAWCALPWGEAGGAQVLDHGPLVFLREDVAPKTAGGGSYPEPAESRLLVLGSNQGAAGTQEKQLDHAEQEARQVANLWSSELVDLRVGEDIHWAELAGGGMEVFDLIHIASHTQVTEGDAGQSAIRMAGVSLDRPLTIPEISNLPVGAGLVFLSCCEGGRIHQSSGNGLQSFAGAFLEAGAGGVIASELVVEDEVARELATTFYRHWLGGMERAAALRAAQKEIRDSGSEKSHPFYWSGYRLYHPGG